MDFQRRSVTIEDKINSLIGTPYDADMYHCYTLVMELQPKAPTLDLIASKTTAVRYMNDDEYPDWKITQSPRDMDICLMGTKDNVYHHAGVFFNGLIVHADLTYVRAEKLDIISKKYSHMRFYTCK